MPRNHHPSTSASPTPPAIQPVGAAMLAVVSVLAVTLLAPPATEAQPPGRDDFRYNTFGSEQLWTDVLRMHEVIPVGLDPLTALDAGLKVDVKALPQEVLDLLEAGLLDLEDADVTVELLRLNAVVGVQGSVTDEGVLTSVGITCALCHSTVDDSLMDGIGRRLDGWANVDLDPGRILSLSPALAAVATELAQWGPGRYDPRHHTFDGMDIDIINEPSLPVVIPPIYGLKGVDWETYTGDGHISYWNKYVGVTQMGGQGTFVDDRIDVEIVQEPDLVEPELADLLKYQLRLKTPRPPRGSFDHRAAARGRRVFASVCASCHQPPTYTDVNEGPDADTPLLHDPDDVGTETEYATRSATGEYRTTPLRGLWQHPPYFHDGSAADLEEVVENVEHYDENLQQELTDQQKADLVEFLKSL
jgi:mono/diheme cytochrome c family protein